MKGTTIFVSEYNESDNSEDKVGSGDKMLGTSIQWVFGACVSYH